MEDGIYTVIAHIEDQRGNTVSRSVTALNVHSAFKIEGFVAGPSPYKPGRDQFSVEYTLTQPCEVRLSLFSIDGEQQWQHRAQPNDPNGGSLGFNQILWDGINRYGESMANGPYILMLSARYEGQHKLLKQSILILK